MSNNAANNGNLGTSPKVVEVNIGERVFKMTNPGLDENEIRSYVVELINQRDALHKRQAHISALKELAEKTIIEASTLSETIVQKATEEAKSEAAKIKAKAEEESSNIIQKKKAEAKAIVDKETEALRLEAQRKLKTMHDEQLKSLKSEAFMLAQRLQHELLTNLESIKKNVMTIGANFEKFQGAGVLAEKPITGNNKTGTNALSEGEKGALLDHIPWLEIEVLPPMDIEKIMDLINRLESLPEVKTTDLLPETPNPLIRVFLNEPSPLAEILRTLPQVENVDEVSNVAGDGDDAIGAEKRERIRVVLGKNPDQVSKTGNQKDTTNSIK